MAAPVEGTCAFLGKPHLQTLPPVSIRARVRGAAVFVVCFLLLIGLFLCHLPLAATAQTPTPPGELITLARQAIPAQLLVGQEAVIQATLSDLQAVECASAQPQPADVVLVIDVSTSMDDENKIAAARDAATQFVKAMDLRTDRVAVVAFSGSAFVVQTFVQDAAVAQQSIAGLSTIDGTDIAAGLVEADGVLGSRRAEATANVVLLSDGGSDQSAAVEAARGIKSRNLRVFTISLGSDADQVLMADLASSPADHYHAPNPSDLAHIYDEVRQRIQTAGVTDVHLALTYDDTRLELVPGSLSPQGTANGNTLAWSLPAVEAGTPQALRFRVRALQAGAFPASPSAHVEYVTCGDQPHALDQGPGADLSVTAPPMPVPPSPCQAQPLSNGCLSSVVCLGGAVWPCTALGLPWWVCLILLLLIPLAALLWWLWRRREQQRQQVKDHAPGWSSISVPSSGASGWSPLPTPGPSASLVPTPPPADVQRPARTLVVGLGGSGASVAHALEATLREAYGAPPPTVRWLAIDVDGSGTSDEQALKLPCDRAVADLAERAAVPGEGLPQVRAWFPPGASTDRRDRLAGRALNRLALFVGLRQVKERLGAELRVLQSQPGDDTTVYVVGSLAGLTGSALLADVAHLARMQAQAEGISRLAIHAIAFLPEAYTTHLDLTAQSSLYRAAAAAWRELHRFQLVFDRPYPFVYLDERTVRQGKLFERVYLVSPDRQDGPSLAAVPLDSGLYPAVADAIAGLADPLTRRAWEEVARATDMRMNEKQQRRQEPLYRSLGSFVYVLPVEDLAERLALRFTADMVTALRESDMADARGEALSFLAQPASPTGVGNTLLIQSVAQIGPLGHDESATRVDKRGLHLADWLGVASEDAQQKIGREAVYELATSGVRTHVLTSDVARAPDYAADTQRVLEEAKQAIGRLDQVGAWLAGCEQVQRQVLARLLDERLAASLHFNPTRAGSTGPASALDFLAALERLVAGYSEAVTAVCACREQQAAGARQYAQERREALEAVAPKVRARHPHYGHAILGGVVPAAGLTLVLGALSLAVPGLFLPLGGLALAAAGAGAWLSHRMLFGGSALVRHQRDYLAAEQDRLAAEVELALYRGWERIASGWLETIRQALQPLRAWDAALASLASTRLPELRAPLDARRVEQSAIRVRRYLDDDTLEDALYRRFFDAQVLEEARARLAWQREGEASWSPCIGGADVQRVDPHDLSALEGAFLDLARAYASRVRALHIADVMAEWYSARSVAEEAGPGSAPLVRTRPDLQPESEDTRLVAVQTGTQPAYFDEILRILRKPAAQVHTERLAEASHPHRCHVLASLDALRPAGLPSWERALEVYASTPGQARAALHVFPAEVNAARWETLMLQINLQPVTFSPPICLALEDERRALAFWRAVASGWAREREVAGQGISHRQALTLVLPGAKPESQSVLLTAPGEEMPSLWDAAVSFTLADSGDQALLSAMEAAWERFIQPPDVSTRRIAISQLEKAIARATEMRESPDRKTAESGVLLHLVAEDGLRRLYGESPLFGQPANT